MANSGAAETLVPREEQPVSIEPPKTPPRVISTIPVVGGQNVAQPGMTVGQAPAGMAPNVQSSSPWPPPPPMPNASARTGQPRRPPLLLPCPRRQRPSRSEFTRSPYGRIKPRRPIHLRCRRLLPAGGRACAARSAAPAVKFAQAERGCERTAGQRAAIDRTGWPSWRGASRTGTGSHPTDIDRQCRSGY